MDYLYQLAQPQTNQESEQASTTYLCKLRLDKQRLRLRHQHRLSLLPVARHRAQRPLHPGLAALHRPRLGTQHIHAVRHRGLPEIHIQIGRHAQSTREAGGDAPRKRLVEHDAQQPAVHEPRVAAELRADVEHRHHAAGDPAAAAAGRLLRRHPHERRHGDHAGPGERAGDEVRRLQRGVHGSVGARFFVRGVGAEGLHEGEARDEVVGLRLDGGVGVGGRGRGWASAGGSRWLVLRVRGRCMVVGTVWDGGRGETN